MEKQRLTLFIILAALILFGSQFLLQKLYPPPKKPTTEQVAQTSVPAPVPSAFPVQAQPTAPTQDIPQAELREITLKTPYWNGKLSNQGAVITEWTMTHSPNGKPVDPPNGVNLISAQKSQEIGAPLRLLIPSDRNLEKELNTARFALTEDPGQNVELKPEEKKTITFNYINASGISATKTLIFSGSGFDFDLKVDVKRNGQPVETSVVVGPSFGDQSLKEFGYYKPAPQATYSASGSVERNAGTDITTADPVAIAQTNVLWAAVDDNYFAMAVVPSSPAKTASILNVKRKEKVGDKEIEHDHVSIAIPVVNDQINHVYAGPKDLDTLAEVNKRFGLANQDKNLEYLISYGWNIVAWIVKPIAAFMRSAFVHLYGWTGNYGWAIILLTVALNMCFFPLRWRSSVSMKKAAALQPKMKDLQERMKKLDKNDPRTIELQKEQMALMREGNPLMGCLPLLLQMPFFWAVFIVLSSAIEFRNAKFFGWVKDLSSPDPWFVLPVIFVISMIVQTALTPTTADPIQKRMQYFMPLMMGYFFIYAPAGLVLYWMVGNLVGIAQQYVINKMTPSPPTQPDSKKSDLATKGKKSKELLANS
jgi:YidC/Oxa1 family membrane protein insertase